MSVVHQAADEIAVSSAACRRCDRLAQRFLRRFGPAHQIVAPSPGLDRLARRIDAATAAFCSASSVQDVLLDAYSRSLPRIAHLGSIAEVDGASLYHGRLGMPLPGWLRP